MKNMIFVLIMIVGLFIPIICCEFQNEEYDPLTDVEIGKMDNYYFENDIKINSFNEATRLLQNFEYIDESLDFWQLPEETWKLKSGDCEDYCIFLMYILKEKLNIETNLIMIKKGNNVHTLVYPIYLDDGIPYYYETVNNFISQNLLSGWSILHKIPYDEVMWMTYNYHDNVGKYR